MNLLDVLLVLAAIWFGVSGYRQGFIVGAMSFAGFLGGGIAAMATLPRFLGAGNTTAATALGAVMGVLLCSFLGQLIASLLGTRLRDRVTWQPARAVDAGAGAVMSVLAVLVITWFVGTAVAGSDVPAVARQVRNSAVLGVVDRVMPAQASTVFSSFRKIFNSSGFPEVFAGIGPERIIQVDPPNTQVLTTEGLRQSQPSVVKILGAARSCGREVEGSGFVYAPERVMTNAHVVAGVTRPRVILDGNGRALTARVVVYDPQRDIAVLYVPGLRRTPLELSVTGKRGDDAVVAGYPKNGPFSAVAARIRSELKARGTDIYGQQQVDRQIFSLFADVESGNSGGPLLSPDGTVYGVIFAKSVEDPTTGYALTAEEVAADAQAGASATQQVSTLDCA